MSQNSVRLELVKREAVGNAAQSAAARPHHPPQPSPEAPDTPPSRARYHGHSPRREIPVATAREKLFPLPLRGPRMASPTDRVYSASHEWHKLEGDVLTLGLTQFAVDQLTDVTYVEMKKPGFSFASGGMVGEVESVKTTSDIYCFVEGEVIEVNTALADNPGLLNTDPLGKGWLAKIRVKNKDGLAKCMDAAAYDASH